MDRDWLQRTEVLLGKPALDRLGSSRVAIIGLGGVGSAVAEALCRSGVGHLMLVDGGTVADSNRNRQLLATVDTIGKEKASVCALRLTSINSEGNYLPLCLRLTPDNLQEVFDWTPDCIVDAIDTITTKIALVNHCYDRAVPLFMSMGTGGRIDPTQLRSGVLADTRGTGCSLARILRRTLRGNALPQGIVYSLEPPNRAVVASDDVGRHPPSSSAFVPPAAGLALASLAIRFLIREDLFVK